MPAGTEELHRYPLQRLGERIETPLIKGQVYVIHSTTDGRKFVAKYVEMISPTVARFMGFCEIGVVTHFEHEATVNLTTHHVHPCPDGLFALYTLHIGGPSNTQFPEVPFFALVIVLRKPHRCQRVRLARQA